PLRDREGAPPLELFQIWLNLPHASKMVEPHFAMFWNDAIPRRVTRDEAGRPTEVTVVAGRFGDAQPPPPPPKSWAAHPDSHVAVWTLKMAPDARFTLPATPPRTNRTLYFFPPPPPPTPPPPPPPHP